MTERSPRAVAALLLAVTLALASAGPAAATATATEPVSFETALAQALLRSPDLRKYGATVEAADQEVIRARSPFLPRLDLLSSNQRIKTYSSIPGLESLLLSGRDKIYHSSSYARLSMNVFNGGSDLAGLRLAREKRQDAELQLQLRRATLASRVLDQYHTVVQTALEVRAADLQLAAKQSQLRRAQAELADGRVSEFAVTEARYDLQFKELARASKERAHRNARQDLLLTLGAEATPAQDPGPTFELRAPRYDEGLRQFGFDTASLAREVEIFESRFRQSQQEVERAKGRFLPKLEVFAKTDFVGISESGFKSAWDERVKDKHFLGITLTWNLFDGFDSVGEMRAATKRVAGAQAEYDLALDEQRKRVAEATRPLVESREDLQTERQRLDILRRKLALNRLKRELGKLDARALEESETDVMLQELELEKREETAAYQHARLMLTQGIQ